jgi:hypothetical protein
MHDPNAFAGAPLERSCEGGVMRIYDVVQLGDNAKTSPCHGPLATGAGLSG